MSRRRRAPWAAPAFLAALLWFAAGCESGRDKLLADLQSTRPHERAVALGSLARQSRPEDLILFIRAAKDPAPLGRAEATLGLGASQDPRVVDLLGELLEDADEAVQAKAALALAQFQGEKASKARTYLMLQYSQRGPATRLAIFRALQASQGSAALAQLVAAEAKALWERNLRALTIGGLPERVAAAEELGKSGRQDAVAKLLGLIEDSQVILAAAAVRGLGYAGDPRTVEPIALLLTENFPQLREAACDALGRLAAPQSIPVLQEVATERTGASALATAALLSFPRSPQTDAALCEIAREAGPKEGLAAGRRMRARGGCPPEPILAKLAKPSDALAVAQGLQAIAGLGPEARALLPKALPFLSHSEARVRHRAFEAVAAIGDSSAAPAVAEAYQSEVRGAEAARLKWVKGKLPHTVTAADAAPGSPPSRFEELMARVRAVNDAKAEQSGKVSPRPAQPGELANDLSEERVALVGTALEALGSLKVQGALDLLKQHLEDPSPAIRRSAYLGLARLGKEGAEAARAGLLEPDRETQGAVAEALCGAGDAGQRTLLELLPKLAGDKVRQLEALERCGAPAAAAPLLEALLADRGPEVGPAASLLGELEDKGAVDSLLQYLDDPGAAARREALVALGRIGDARAADKVAEDLTHDSPEIRAAAASALGRIGGEAQRPLLEALKGDYDRQVRESASQALEQLKEGDAGPGTGGGR